MDRRLIRNLFFCFVLCYLPVAGAKAEQSVVDQLLDRHEVWTGDLDGMVERKTIRALVAYSKTFYFLDGAHQRGLSYDALQLFDKFVNTKFKTKTLKIKIVVIPVARDRLLPALVEGRGDIALANLTVTPERLKTVDFSDPFLTDVREIVVTGPSGPKLTRIDDLSSKEILVRPSSSYYQSLRDLNLSFARKGIKGMALSKASELLEDEDLLEMVNADLVPAIVVDEHKAEFWAQIFDNITLNRDVAVRTGGAIAWAMRKNSPKLRALVNEFAKKHRKGTKLGNILFQRYLKDTKWVESALSKKEIAKFDRAIDLFRKYAGQYEFDWLMVGALAYQESGLDHTKRSKRGAVGVMQILPRTAADPNVNIPDIHKIENNIHAGVKYLKFLHDRYFKDEDMNQLNRMLFTFASYNAGPAKITSLRKAAAKTGLDPNDWFRNVEIIAAKKIGRETVQYVSNIYKYYIAYGRIIDQRASKKAAFPVKE